MDKGVGGEWREDIDRRTQTDRQTDRQTERERERDTSSTHTLRMTDSDEMQSSLHGCRRCRRYAVSFVSSLPIEFP
jgi:hypothetical protein